MQMKCLDILHKQMLQVSTVMLEVTKQGINLKYESETEKQ